MGGSVKSTQHDYLFCGNFLFGCTHFAAVEVSLTGSVTKRQNEQGDIMALPGWRDDDVQLVRIQCRAWADTAAEPTKIEQHLADLRRN